jgi:HTH-type transcriptional regulator, transcriptional repressor of NAD biosynthesis genes
VTTPRRIVVTGSESTGKTTLASRLAERFDTVATPEFSRDYAVERRVPLDRHDVEPIAVGQIASEDRWAAHARHGLLVLDTDLFSTVVYAPHYYGMLEPWIERVALERRGALYLLLDIDVPWVADPIRDRGNQRREMHALFRGMLERYALPFVTIGGSWDERLERAVSAVEAPM